MDEGVKFYHPPSGGAGSFLAASVASIAAAPMPSQVAAGAEGAAGPVPFRPPLFHRTASLIEAPVTGKWNQDTREHPLSSPPLSRFWLQEEPDAGIVSELHEGCQWSERKIRIGLLTQAVNVLLHRAQQGPVPSLPPCHVQDDPGDAQESRD